MDLDRIVVTTFPGYFFTTVLCLESIRRYFPDKPIDILLDDFGLESWPDYVTDAKNYLQQRFDILEFHVYSELPRVDAARAGGWFRQQFIKLHLDQIINGNHWLVVDADVVFNDPPDYLKIPLIGHASPSNIDIGNRRYVEYFLDTDKPYVGDPEIYWCASSVPFRYVNRSLLVRLRKHVESVHDHDFLDLHLELIPPQKLVAFDPDGQSMVISEFQLIEVYRHRYGNALPFVYGGAGSKFYHDSIKDWKKDPEWFRQQGLDVDANYWMKLMEFGAHAI